MLELSLHRVATVACALVLAGCSGESESERVPARTETTPTRTSTPVSKDLERDMNRRVRVGLEREGHRVEDIDCTQDTRTSGVCVVDFDTKDGPLRTSVDVKIDRARKRFDWKLVLPPESDIE